MCRQPTSIQARRRRARICGIHGKSPPPQGSRGVRAVSWMRIETGKPRPGNRARSGKIDSCRAIFGDESENYEDALKRHYASGAPPTWQQEFVSAYATSHPWEDFAENFAHYLHIVDTLETARAFGLRTRPGNDRRLSGDVGGGPHHSIERLHCKHLRPPLRIKVRKGSAQKWPGFIPPRSRKMPPLRGLLLHRRVQAGQLAENRADYGTDAEFESALSKVYAVLLCAV